MEPRRPPEYILEVLSDPFSLKDIIKALLHTIFFHRYFTPIRPMTRDLLDITLPTIDDVDLETLIDQRATALVRQMDSQAGYNYGGGAGMGYTGDGGTRGQLAVRFFEKRRRKTYFSFGKGEDDVCWEQWILNISLTRAKDEMAAYKARKAMEMNLERNAQKIINIVNRDKDHIPPITTTDTNPFPYDIVVNPKSDGWGQRIGLF
ncbi:MAG: hypothetical protein M1821_009072 [Bathelium mastoideum]|nr:MAG: hypothetical protein M1821_009072 [Bathelium mastoideum]KAI9689613.1 MAG: hypothetical protein M1822_010265 [Bathelium mastoideum]